jgi:peptidoglycan/LPS O-acetylase OafA/YrhL
LFFVLSGYLITGILYDSKGSTGYFKNFYMRRTLRIFPLYYLALTIMVLVIPTTGLRSELPHVSEIPEVQGWLWTYLTNIYLAGETSFSIPYVSHFWTLGIEEHFYLVWPFVVGLVARRTAMRVCIVASLAALGLRIVLAHTMPGTLAPQVLTPCRVDSLLVGSWFALASRGDLAQLEQRAKRWLLYCVAGALLTSLWHKLAGGLWSGVVLQLRTSILALLFGTFIATVSSTTASPILRRALRNPWLSALGRYSYGLYVYHGVIAAICIERGLVAKVTPTLTSPAAAVLAVACAGILVSLLLSIVSYELIETKFLQLKKHFEPRRARHVPARSAASSPPGR